MKYFSSFVSLIIFISIVSVISFLIPINSGNYAKSEVKNTAMRVVVKGCDNCDWVKYCINEGPPVWVYGSCEFYLEPSSEFRICVQCPNGKTGSAYNVDPAMKVLTIYVNSGGGECNCNDPQKKRK
jgi:hypothetical protein